MPTQKRKGIANRLLLALPTESLNRIKGVLEPVTLVAGQVIAYADEPLRNVYFVNRGIVSIVKTLADGRSDEIGAVGIEGVTSAITLISFERTVLEFVVQIPGSAFRVSRDAAIEEMRRNNQFNRIIHEYARFTLGQIAQTAACNRLHHIEERCCRWLLIAHDSALSDAFPLIDEFLALMLGVQRAGVSIALSALKKAGLIDRKRGRITITNRAGLEEATCGCYAATQRELEHLFGSLK